MYQKLLTLLGKAQSENQSFRYLQSSPIRCDIYKYCLERLQATDAVFMNFGEFQSSETQTSKKRIFVRHDIDTLECINNISLLIDINLQLHIKSGIYVRVDEASGYSLADYRDIINRVRDSGFEVGLHTVCYTQDDYMKAFESELTAFNELLGFTAKSFTVHGMGAHRFSVRQAFNNEIVQKLPSFGIEFTDCHPDLIQYDYVMHDSHYCDHKQKRYIKDDFTSLNVLANSNTLVLTHPCYWVK